MPVMLLVVFCYTLCSLNDKYAVSRCMYDRHELMFLMSAGTVVFLGATLPFYDLGFEWSWRIILPVGGIAAIKYTEFAVLPTILRQMSPFQLKSWVGLTLFISYFTDVIFYASPLSALLLGFIIITFTGLALAARADRRSTDYKKIWLHLAVYVLTKYAYGLVMRSTGSILPTTLTLFFALVIIAVISFFCIDVKTMLSKPEGRKGALIVLLAKLPNTAGLLGENYTAERSLSNYSFIQPLILVVLFVMTLLDRRSKLPALSIIGGAVTVVGIVGFQLAK